MNWRRLQKSLCGSRVHHVYRQHVYLFSLNVWNLLSPWRCCNSLCPVGGCLCWSLPLAACFILKWPPWPGRCSHSDPAPQGQSQPGPGVSDPSPGARYHSPITVIDRVSVDLLPFVTGDIRACRKMCYDMLIISCRNMTWRHSAGGKHLFLMWDSFITGKLTYGNVQDHVKVGWNSICPVCPFMLR